MKRNLLLLISLFLIIYCKSVNAQSIVRATLCSFGNSIVSNEVTLLQTIGQPSNVNVAEAACMSKQKRTDGSIKEIILRCL